MDNLDGYHQINHHWTKDFYGEENAKILDKVSEISCIQPMVFEGGKKYYNNNDIQSDYFDVLTM